MRAVERRLRFIGIVPFDHADVNHAVGLRWKDDDIAELYLDEEAIRHTRRRPDGVFFTVGVSDLVGGLERVARRLKQGQIAHLSPPDRDVALLNRCKSVLAPHVDAPDGAVGHYGRNPRISVRHLVCASSVCAWSLSL